MKLPTYVLVHGGRVPAETWNALRGRREFESAAQLGGRAWDPVRSVLESHGATVLTPELPDEHTTDLSGHVRCVEEALTPHSTDKAIVVGHSYGGMVITGLAAHMPERIERLVYVDAALPSPGESLFDVIALSGRNPLSFGGLEPAAAYVEKLFYDPRQTASVPKTFVACTQSDFSAVTHVMRERIGPADPSWTFRELPTSHFAMATMPEQLAELIESDR
jgi:pimeloyl-ACP methyl ester carboxylesterase